MSRASSYSRSRQKSCVSCAQGKRRCNRQVPQCSRCFARGLECTYLTSHSTRQLQQVIGPSFQPVETPLQPLDDAMFNNPPNNISLFTDTDFLAAWSPLSPSLLAAPTLLPAGYLPDIVVLDKWSTKQLLRGMKRFPQIFAQSRKTPFIHHRLYDTSLPEAMQDAFMVSASYACRTPETEDTILHILESKASSLVRQAHENPVELLAAVQALIIFHIIQLFDGDVRQRAIAEQNMDTLRTWTMQLRQCAGELGPAPTWQEWVFVESARRTAIVSILLEGLYSMLKVGSCTIVRQLSILPFTSGSTFWNMKTDATWIAESHHLASDTVLYGDFSNAFESGRVSGDLNAFEKLLLAPCVGERGREALMLED